MKLKETIMKYVLQNAVNYNGKASAGAIIGKLIAEDPKIKSKLKELNKGIQKTVEEVNSMKLEEQTAKLKELAPELLEEKPEKEKKELKPLKNVKGKVVMRFAPSPSGPMHIGHAMTGCLTSLYIKKYGGKFILRIEDTNPENIYPPAYKMLPEDGDWLFGNVSEVWVQSDRMEIYYDYADKLLKLGSVYVCTCKQDEFKEHSKNKRDCPCRGLPIEENNKRWAKMLDKDGFKEGEAILRFKSDMKHINPAMRDFPLFRIKDSEHPSKGFKYRVWPLMNFSVTIDDIEAGMTHIIRAKDHADNAKRQEMIFKALKKKFPETYFLGRINFEGLELSCSKTKERIEKGEFDGWDDIRLPFIISLRRRGYQAGAFMKFSEAVGLSLVDKKIEAEEYFKTLDAYNKEIIDPKANRYFFIENPTEILVEGAPKQKVELKLHPDFPDRGHRVFNTGEKFYIEMADYKSLKKNSLNRLMDCLSFTKEGDKIVFNSLEHKKFAEKGDKIVHWLPVDKGLVNVEIMMPDKKIKKGMAEEGIKKLKAGEVIQFARFGFCRLDKKEKGKFVFWFTHK